MHTVLLTMARLACPVGMALMTWMMVRGSRRGDTSAAAGTADPLRKDASQVEALRTEIELLKADRAYHTQPAAGAP